MLTWCFSYTRHPSFLCGVLYSFIRVSNHKLLAVFWVCLYNWFFKPLVIFSIINIFKTFFHILKRLLFLRFLATRSERLLCLGSVFQCRSPSCFEISHSLEMKWHLFMFWIRFRNFIFEVSWQTLLQKLPIGLSSSHLDDSLRKDLLYLSCSGALNLCRSCCPK